MHTPQGNAAAATTAGGILMVDQGYSCIIHSVLLLYESLYNLLNYFHSLLWADLEDSIPDPDCPPTNKKYNNSPWITFPVPFHTKTLIYRQAPAPDPPSKGHLRRRIQPHHLASGILVVIRERDKPEIK